VTVTRLAGQGPRTARYETTTAPTGGLFRRSAGLPESALAAAPGLDYQAVAGELSFAAGETSKTFAIPVIDDAVAEDPEAIGVAITWLPAPPGSFRTPRDGNATAAIGLLDNEPPPPPLLSAAPVQRLRRSGVRVLVTPQINAARLQIAGTIGVRALRKTWRLQTLRRRNARAGVQLGFMVFFPETADERLKQAAKAGKRISAVVKVLATDSAGRKSVSAVRIRLR
jgi:hypothetical protein